MKAMPLVGFAEFFCLSKCQKGSTSFSHSTHIYGTLTKGSGWTSRGSQEVHVDIARSNETDLCPVREQPGCDLATCAALQSKTEVISKYESHLLTVRATGPHAS